MFFVCHDIPSRVLAKHVFSDDISSIVIEGIKTLLFFSQKVLKRKKKNTNSTFKQTKNFLITLLEI